MPWCRITFSILSTTNTSNNPSLPSFYQSKCISTRRTHFSISQSLGTGVSLTGSGFLSQTKNIFTSLQFSIPSHISMSNSHKIRAIINRISTYARLVFDVSIGTKSVSSNSLRINDRKNALCLYTYFFPRQFLGPKLKDCIAALSSFANSGGQFVSKRSGINSSYLVKLDG